jgi:hypothetical protein
MIERSDKRNEYAANAPVEFVFLEKNHAEAAPLMAAIGKTANSKRIM